VCRGARATRPGKVRGFYLNLLTSSLLTSLVTTEKKKMAEEMDEEQRYFARVDDVAFWADRERVKTLLELYERHSCLWNVRLTEYKNIIKKKTAKIEIGKHFGYSGKQARIFDPDDSYCAEKGPLLTSSCIAPDSIGTLA